MVIVFGDRAPSPLPDGWLGAVAADDPQPMTASSAIASADRISMMGLLLTEKGARTAMMSSNASRSYGFAELFDSFRSPVFTDHDYFVASPPKTLVLDAPQLQALEVREPFFVDHGWSAGPNRELVP